MQELGAVRLTPGAARELAAFRRQIGNGPVNGGQDPVVPRLEHRVEQVRGPFGEQLPYRSFAAKRAAYAVTASVLPSQVATSVGV